MPYDRGKVDALLERVRNGERPPHRWSAGLWIGAAPLALMMAPIDIEHISKLIAYYREKFSDIDLPRGTAEHRVHDRAARPWR